ncbi:putative vacuolar cation/proton exchanger 2 [Xylariaceae sp. FL0804]|nr:putative vacuolar cation/proton exchanger 2 [Xylariaceae sp. FL0804]
MAASHGYPARERPSHHSSREQALPTTRQDIMNGTSEKSQREPKQKGPVRVKTAGESGRRGIHPLHFFTIIWRSSSRLSRAVNVLWPFVPAALAVYWWAAAKEDNGKSHGVLTFSLAYVAMVPCANLVGFAGQELARKMPHMLGVLTETTLGSVVEIIMFMVLLVRGQYNVIRAAILGSILATMLLCLGLCFFTAGLKRETATFSEAISEVGTGLLLMAGLGLAIPTIFSYAINSSDYGLSTAEIDTKTERVSHIVAILLLIAYCVYIWFQMRTHHGIYDAVFEYDEHRDEDGHRDQAKAKLTLTECIIALAISVALVTLIAIALIEQIEFVIEEGGVSDPFMGLILVPLVEKAAEHLTAVDEAWDNQMNLALSHCIGATIQTAMLNAPLVVIVGWGLGKPFDLGFEIFDIAVLILGIITVGNYLRDQKSDYLEGFLCIITYTAIAVAAFYFPNPPSEISSTEK